MKFEELEINHKYIVDESKIWERSRRYFDTIVVAKFEKSKLIQAMNNKGDKYYCDERTYKDWQLMEDLGEVSIYTEPVNIPTTISSPKIYPDDIKIHHTTGTNPDYLKPTTTCSSSTKSQDILEEINIPNTFIPTNKEIAEPTGLSGNIEKELEYELVFDPVKHVDKSKVLGPGNSTIEIMTQCLSCQNYNPNLKNCGLDSNAIAKDLSGRCYTYRKKLEDKPDPKCLCEVYNTGCIAINKDCPFHGHLLNGKSAL